MLSQYMVLQVCSKLSDSFPFSIPLFLPPCLTSSLCLKLKAISPFSLPPHLSPFFSFLPLSPPLSQFNSKRLIGMGNICYIAKASEIDNKKK